MGYVITYANCPIIWVIRLQTEIAHSTTEAEYISLLKYMRYVLPLVSLVKGIELVLNIQGDTLTVLCSLFEIRSHFTKIIKGRYHSQLL